MSRFIRAISWERGGNKGDRYIIKAFSYVRVGMSCSQSSSGYQNRRDEWIAVRLDAAVAIQGDGRLAIGRGEVSELSNRLGGWVECHQDGDFNERYQESFIIPELELGLSTLLYSPLLSLLISSLPFPSPALPPLSSPPPSVSLLVYKRRTFPSA